MEMTYDSNYDQVLHASPESAISLIDYINGKNDNEPEESQLLERLSRETRIPSNDEFYSQTLADIDWETSRYAVLQPGIKSEKYEIIYISDERTDGADPYWECEKIFAFLNSPAPRPYDYYGYSLSTGDIIVLYGDENFRAFRADTFGFTELKDYLDDKTWRRILACLDVRKERNLLANLACSMSLPQSLDERLRYLNEYNPVFELADSRKKDFYLRYKDPYLGSLQEVNMAELNKSTTYFAVGKEPGNAQDYSLFCLNYTLPVKSVFSDRFETPEDAKKFLLDMVNNNPCYKGNAAKLVSLKDLNRIQQFFFEKSEELETSLADRINEISAQLENEHTCSSQKSDRER
ncbi:MAG: YodL domain-containing protein [Anaerovoracaceae bacterium]